MLPAALLATSSPASAQGDLGRVLLPRARYFASPFADPVEPRTSIGLLVTNVLEHPGRERQPFVVPDLAGPDDARSDLQAAANLGVTFPLWRPLIRPEGGIVVAGQAGVFARFRMELPSRDDLGQDWLVAMPIEAAWNRWSGRVRISHRSSHLGDEFVQATDATRIEFGGEQLDGLAAYGIPPIGRVYAGGGWIFRSYTDNTAVLRSTGTRDRYQLQFGGDGRWDLDRAGHVNVLGGIDWQTAERTGWDGSLSVGGGMTVQHEGRSFGLVARYFEGASSLGQFFVTPEEFWSLELYFEF